MRGITFSRFGEPVEVLRVEELPRPEPGPGEALVRLRLASINPSDLLTVRGQYGRLPKLPATPGLEGMGIIEALGAGVHGLHPGQRVIPLGAAGTWQEYIAIDAARLIPVPESVTDATAAQFVVNPLTAWIMTTQELDLQPGQWLLQSAAGSTLGRVALQIAQVRGFNTINVVRRREQVKELRELGADEVICSADEDIVERVMAITDGAGAAGAIDAVGGATGSALLRALGAGGILLVYGALSAESITLDPGQMIFRGTTAHGFWLSAWIQRTPPAHMQAVMGELLSVMAQGHIVPPVEAEYDLAQIHDAVRHAERSGRQGKVLLSS